MLFWRCYQTNIFIWLHYYFTLMLFLPFLYVVTVFFCSKVAGTMNFYVIFSAILGMEGTKLINLWPA
jgi:hypothetical protein